MVFNPLKRRRKLFILTSVSFYKLHIAPSVLNETDVIRHSEWNATLKTSLRIDVKVFFRDTKHVGPLLQKAIRDLSNKAPVMLCLCLPIFPSPKLSTRCVAVSGSACYGGGKGAKACTTNSAHERLMQQEQLSSIVSLQISSVPHFASQCVSSKRAGEGRVQRRKQTKIRWKE